MMKEIREAMHTLNFVKYESLLFRAIAGVLHLGNVVFQKSDDKGMEGVTIQDTSGSR
jgi:myosin heavy subunit